MGADIQRATTSLCPFVLWCLFLHCYITSVHVCTLQFCRTLLSDQASDTRQDVHAPAANLTELKRTTALREKMDVMRDKRRVNDMLGFVRCFAVVLFHSYLFY